MKRILKIVRQGTISCGITRRRSAGGHLFKQQPQHSLGTAIEFAEAVCSPTCKESHGGTAGSARGRNCSHGQCLATARGAVQQYTPAQTSCSRYVMATLHHGLVMLYVT